MVHKGGVSAINYIKIFQYSKALEILVESSYSDYQVMHSFLEKFKQGRGNSAQISKHQAELKRENILLIKNHFLYLPYKLITWTRITK